jgi:DNA replication protein DnaC
VKTIAELGIHAEAKTRSDACPSHGPFMAKCYIGAIWSKCPQCEEARAAREKAESEAKARETRLRAWQRRIGEAGIPERFRQRSLHNFVAESSEQQRALAFACAYADNFSAALHSGRSAIFVGKPGTGKTHLAVSIGLRLMAREQRTVMFCTVMRAIRRVKNTWSRGSSEHEGQAIAALVSPDLLILDEVGVQFGSDTERLILFDVLNERYEKRKPSLLLSNLPIDEVRNFLGERIYDRLREDGGEMVVFDWESYRPQASV